MSRTGQARRLTRMGTWKRRGLVAGLAGVVAGVLAREAERTAEAGHNANVGANPLHLGLNNTNDMTTITTMTAGVANGFAFRVDNDGTNGSAIVGESAGTGIAVRGNSPQNVAVLGANGPGANNAAVISPPGAVQGIGPVRGVTGFAAAPSGAPVGVLGVTSGTDPGASGVRGESPGGMTGVRGQSGSNAVDGATKLGVDGLSQQAGGIGVRGQGGDVGVKGIGITTGTGVLGTSTGGVGVFGASENTGVGGNSAGGIGVFGATVSGTDGLFSGPVVVQGDFTVTGAKSAAVPLPGGRLGRTYAMECPDSWLADFGEGQPTAGFRRVPIDPKFASMVDLSGQYHVIITPLAEAILYVTNRTSDSFDVRAIPFADGDDKHPHPEPIRFTWWVIGHRKDIKRPRFEEVKIPPPPKLP